MSYTTKKPALTEHNEQTALFAWAEIMATTRRHPELAMMFAIANGAGVAHQVSYSGVRYSAEGAKLKREGLKRGVPDICLAVPRGKYHGMYIEMKRKGGTKSDVRPEQVEWIERLASQGYHVHVAYGEEDARRAICEYLGIEDDAYSFGY